MTQESLTFAVDPEHSRLRLVVAVVFVVLAILLFFALSLAFPASGLNLLASIGALVVAAVMTQYFERQLKRRWPSGRQLRVSSNTLELLKDEQSIHKVTFSADSRLLRWYFTVQRRSRVPKGWAMVALAVQDENATVAAYTLMSPQQLEQINANEKFTLLQKPVSGAATTEELRLAGLQKRLHEAEQLRWQDGAEMTLADFTTLAETIERYIP